MRADSFTTSLPLRPLAVEESLAVRRGGRRKRKTRDARSPDPALKALKVAEAPKVAKALGAARARVKGRRSPKPSIPAAVCLLSALVAGSASQADAHAFRKDMPIHDDMYSSSAFPALASVKFSNTPELYYIPTPEHESNWRPIIKDARDFRKEYPVNYKPKKDDQDLRDAQASAKMPQIDY